MPRSLKDTIIPLLEQRTASVLKIIGHEAFNGLEEIRLRSGQPLMLQDSHGDWFLREDGALTKNAAEGYTITETEVQKSFELISKHSLYAFQEEIKNGFITLSGGHRVGLAGRMVMEAGNIKGMKDIAFLNIRISKEIIGCADEAIKYIANRNEIYNTLIVSPPQCGKTTMLRDIARVISDGGVKVSIIDERSEIASCHKGVPQTSVGIRTDVLDACPKRHGMLMALRSLSPSVIVTDEIGNSGDKEAIMQVVNAGVKIITTAHGYNLSQLKARKEILELIEEKVFDRYIVLSNSEGPGTIEEVMDGSAKKILYKRGEMYAAS